MQKRSSLRVGILAIHGSVAEHAASLRALGHEPVLVRLPADLDGLSGLILPGGESTALDDLAQTYGLKDAILKFARTPQASQLPAVFGTCAGLILLARWGLLNVEVARNAYGRQIASFEKNIVIASEAKQPLKNLSRERRGGLQSPRDDSFDFPAIFIRAPKITHVGAGVEILARENKTPVLVRQGSVFGASFHPELTTDSRVHALIFGTK